MSARADIARAVGWIELHPSEWMELQRACLRLESMRDEHGRPLVGSITRGGLYMLCEVHGIPVTDSATFRRDHNLWAVLSRYLTELHPQLARVIRHRECDVARHVRAHGLEPLDDRFVAKGVA